MDIINKFLIKLFNNKIGSDEFGNQYYLSKNKSKRYIVYNGIAEPTKIPSDWHIWIHYKTDKIPSSYQSKKYFWQKNRIPNLTGTINSYFPQRYIRNTPYQSWEPNQSK